MAKPRIITVDDVKYTIKPPTPEITIRIRYYVELGEKSYKSSEEVDAAEAEAKKTMDKILNAYVTPIVVDEHRAEVFSELMKFITEISRKMGTFREPTRAPDNRGTSPTTAPTPM